MSRYLEFIKKQQKEKIRQSKEIDWTEVAVKEMAQEVNEATKNLIQIGDIDISLGPDRVFEKLHEKHLTIEGIDSGFKRYLRLSFKGRFVAGIMVEFQPNLNIFKRTLTENDQEDILAGQYLQGQVQNFNLTRSE